MGRLDHFTIGFCGDLKFGRTVHSLIKALSRYEGIKIVLISPKAFSQIKFVGYEEAPQDIHFPLRKKLDELARHSYLSNKKGSNFDPNDILMIDIIRGEIKANDPRLR